MHREYRLWGPPGTGKTTELANVRIPKAIERFGTPWAVAACSFSKAAAEELRTRCGLPEEHVGTLHSLCYRAMGRREILNVSPKLRAAWNAAHPVWAFSGAMTDEEDVADYQGGKLGDAKYPGDALYAAVDLRRHRREEITEFSKVEGDFFLALQDFLEEHEAVDFTGMVEWGLDAPFPLPKARALVVDEAQDLSALDMAVVRNWGRYVDHLLLAGDPNQSIYGFRGAVPEAFDDPSVAVAEEWVLGQSYRLPRAVQVYAESILASASKRQFEYKPREAEGSVVRVASGSFDQMRPATLARLHADGKRAMYLASCSYQLTSVVDKLKQAGVPFHNPYRPRAGAWNPMRGGVDRLREFVGARNAEKISWTFRSLWRWAEHLDAERVLVKGAKAAIQSSAKREGNAPALLTAGELRGLFASGVYDDVVRLLQSDAQAAVRWYIDHVRETYAGMYTYPETIVRLHGVAKLLEHPKVVVGTIHSVKGGEADHVFMTSALSPRANAALRAGNMEAMRVLYVGATRAKETLTVFGR